MSKSRRVQSATEDFAACAKARKVPLRPGTPLRRETNGGLRLHIRRRHHSLGPQRLRRPADIASTNAWFKKIAADGTAEPALERQMAA